MSFLTKMRASVGTLIGDKPRSAAAAKKKALWLIAPVVKQFAYGENPEQGILSCPQASARLRMGIAAAEWRRAGNEVDFLVPEDGEAREALDFNTVGVCVVHKFLSDSEYGPWMQTCETAKKSGCPLVVDICDSPFHKRPPPVSEFYTELLKMCDAVVVNSEKMGEGIAPYSAHPPVVIEDAILADPIEPFFAPSMPLRILWFGHPRNLPTLGTGLGLIVPFAKRYRSKLTVVTEPGRGAEGLVEKLETKFAPALEAEFIPWSLETTAEALYGCDLVMLPSDPANPFYASASANRIAEVLNAGRFPVATPIQSYLPFSEAAWLGENLAEGMQWALVNPQEVRARIARGQAMVREKFSPQQLGRRWRELFESVQSQTEVS